MRAGAGVTRQLPDYLKQWIAGAVIGLTGAPDMPAMERALGGLLYTGGSVGLLLSVPELAGLSRDQIRFAVQWRTRPLP